MLVEINITQKSIEKKMECDVYLLILQHQKQQYQQKIPFTLKSHFLQTRVKK